MYLIDINGLFKGLIITTNWGTLNFFSIKEK